MEKKLPKNYKEVLKRLEERGYKIEFQSHLSYFRKQFNKRFTDFIVGAFALVTALLWSSAINKTLNSERVKTFFSEAFPILKDEGLSYATAFVVTVVAVVMIVIISKLLKLEEK